MAEIVAGVAMSHSPMIMTNEAGGGEKGQRFSKYRCQYEKMAGGYGSRCDRLNFG